MRVDLSYVSASCNRTPNICDWGNNGLICYGTCNSIIIYNPKHPGTSTDVKTLISHTKRINAVKWIRCKNDSPETELISASTDCTAIIWSFIDGNYKPFVLKGHEDGVNIIEAIYKNDNKDSLIIVTASIDSTVRIWKRDIYGGDVLNLQVIQFDRGLALALSLTFFPHTNTILLACARDNSKVQLYAQFEENNTETFKLVEILKGHENWVRGLDFTTDDNGNVYLASCAQDSFIRIWCISPSTESTGKKSLIEMLTAHKMHAMETNISIPGEKGRKYFSIHLESVLCGHEGWVYEVNWCPKIRNEDGSFSQPMKLLSSSLDKTMLIWTLDESTGFWMESVRVGEVGGNTLGFYGSKFSPDGQSIIGHGYLGSFHLWNYSTETKTWIPGVTIGGHSSEVVDLAWEPEGEFLISASLDQTTRIHAPWVQDGNKISWHELARPQVHGYDMSCLAILSRYKFVSGAEEKIVRAFAAPSNFVVNFRRICGVSDDEIGDQIISGTSNGPRGASVPSLGLSNKAVYNSSNETEATTKGKEAYPEDSYFHEIELDAPPTEENLLQNTLWPEVQKLYGHGYEVFSLAASNDGNLVASACKATTTEHAAIILWDANTWHQIQKLSSHNLTVTQIMFSPDDNKILSVSRDRRWTIFSKNLETNEYILRATTDKKNGVHGRIIWCCGWSHDSKYFATGSRDGRTVIWREDDAQHLADSLELKGESITAIAFAPVLAGNCYLLCLGLETGVLMFYKWDLQKSWEKCLELNQSLAHHLTVKRIFFRPRTGLAGIKNCNEEVLQVASCSSDHSVKIHNVYLNLL